MRFPTVIPLVFAADLAFAALIGFLYYVAPSRTVKRLALVVFAYVLLEAFAHVYLERLASEMMRRWF